MRLLLLWILAVISGGSGGGTIDPFNPVVTVDSTDTIGTGGTDDWWGRASIVRRPSDNALILFYYRSTTHSANGGELHIRFSDDDGDTWSAEDETLAAAAVTGFPMNPPNLTGVQDAGEPWAIVAANGDILVAMWKVDYGGSNAGSYLARSTDGGETWNTPAQISFSGGTLSSSNTFMTDDGFLFNRAIYAGVRTYDGASQTDGFMSLMRSTDDGATWEYVSDITGPSEAACIEVGLEYVGNDTIIAMIRDLAHTNSYKRVSTDMGATWGSLTDVTSTVGIAGRQRVYTMMHLAGEAGWWKDPRLVMTGYVHQTSGDSQDRRNAVWISPDRGTTWDGPHYIDTTTEDAGYGDIFVKADGTYGVISYDGTLNAADLKQYNLSITGL
jgi:hypothetical protein